MKEIQNLLLKISNILKENNETEWSATLISLYEESFSHKETGGDQSFLIRIMDLYGGTGYLNDVVLQKDGRSLIKENTEFYRLRHALYQKCIETKTSSS